MSQQVINTSGNEQELVLKQCWQAIQLGKKKDQSGQQYMDEENVVQWIFRVLAQKNQIEQFSNVDFHDQLTKYMKDVCQIDKSQVTNVSFKFQEVKQFYIWLNSKYQTQHETQLQNSKQIKKNKSIQRSKSQQKQQEKQLKQQQQRQKQQKQQEQQNYLYPGGKSPPKKKSSAEIDQQNQNQFADDGGQMQTQGNQNTQQSGLSKNYRQYLQIIFDHYCRMSYATGNDPTFDQIQQKTQVMTINKFMILCKDFGIVKLNNINRNVLVEMFKKNSQFHKDMTFQQFMTVLLKIAHMVFSSESQAEQNENSKYFQQMLLFLQVNNIASFRKKAQSLNISFKTKGSVQIKKEPNLAKPKYNIIKQVNGKNEQQVREQLQQRKRIRSQNKLKALQNFQKRNVSSKKNMIKLQHQLRDANQRGEVRTTQPTKKLAPPIPPARKSSNSTNYRPPMVDPLAGVVGYANIHKIKSQSKQGHIQSKLRLNSVVQQAKRMMELEKNQEGYEYSYPIGSRVSTHGRQTPYSNYNRNMSNANLQQIFEREMSHSSNQQYSQRDLGQDIPISKRAYAPHGHSYLEKKVVKKFENQDLKGIIDHDDDEDEFLEEHLNRQKKTAPINQRIQKKIKQYQQKVDRY